MEYFEKPTFAPSQNTWTKSLLSMLAVLAVYYFLFDQDLINALSVVFVLLIHEAGHYYAMKHYGYQDVKMFFMPFMGAYVVGEKEQITQKQNVIVILAGPIPGMLIGLALNIISYLYGLHEFNSLINMFVLINAFNLLPVTPLDGGRLVEVLFVGAKDMVLSIFMILSMMLIAVFAWYAASFFVLLFIIFLYTRLRMLWKTKSIRNDLAVQNINYTKYYSALSNEEYGNIRKIVAARMPEFVNNYSQEARMVNIIKGVLQDPPSIGLSNMVIFFISLIWLVSITVAPLTVFWLRNLH